MDVFTKIIGWIFIPFKILFELLDPVLRFVEMAINIPLSFIIGTLVDLINAIPCIWKIHIGELVLGILSGVGFFFLNKYVIHWNIHLALLILVCVGIAVVGYFISYLFFKFVIDFITSIVSLVIVVVRVAIYLPGSILMTVIKIVVSIGAWCAIFFPFFSFWTSSVQNIVTVILIFIAIMIVFSIIFLFIRNDVKFNDVGNLGDATLDQLSSFTHSIGLYIMTMGSIPVYIGRAIEFKNGGLRKRLRDYQRGANSHSSGTWIQNHVDDLNVYVLELGHTENDVDDVKFAETSMISGIYTKLNKVDAGANYAINIIGYIIGASLACVISYVYLKFTSGSIAIMAYAFIVMVVCIIFYFIENNKKWA